MTTHRRGRGFGASSQTQDFWPSFTDVMSTVAMLLFFLMLLSYIQNIMTGRELTHFRAELEETRAELLRTNDELAGSQKSLDESIQSYAIASKNLEDTELELNSTERRLQETELAITEKEEALKYLEDEISKARAEIEEGQRQLTLSQQEVESSQEIIAASNEELGNLRMKLEEIAVMRVGILRRVRDSIASEIGEMTDDGQERVSIGENANIVINESLLFDYNSAEVKGEAEEMLAQLAIAFERLLDDAETRTYIDYISIEGHTDSDGSAEYNRALSAERAVSVVDYMMQSNPALQQKYASYFGTGGFSKFRPLTDGQDDESKARNRRIEISVVVKDDSIRKMIEDYLNESTAGEPTAGVAP